MFHIKSISGLCVVAVVFFSSAADATLIDRGNGMICDTDLNITWLQDANYAKTSHYYYDYYDIAGLPSNMYELVYDQSLERTTVIRATSGTGVTPISGHKI